MHRRSRACIMVRCLVVVTAACCAHAATLPAQQAAVLVLLGSRHGPAEVLVDGVRVATLLGEQVELPVAPGVPHEVRVRKVGFDDFATEVTLPPGGVSEPIRVNLAARPVRAVAGRAEDLPDAGECGATGAGLALAQAPAGATLLIDGNPAHGLNATPSGSLFELPSPGTHVALVTADGYPEVSFGFEVADGEWIAARLRYPGYPELSADTVLVPVPPRPSLQAEPRPVAPAPPLSQEELQSLRSDLAKAARSRPHRGVLQIGGILTATLGVGGLAMGLTSHTKSCGVDYWAGPTRTCRLERDEPSAVLYAASGGLIAAGIVMTALSRGRPLPDRCGTEARESCMERLSEALSAAEADSAAYPHRKTRWEADSLSWERRHHEALMRLETEALPAWRATVDDMGRRNAVQHANLQRNTTVLQEWLDNVRRGEFTPTVGILRCRR